MQLRKNFNNENFPNYGKNFRVDKFSQLTVDGYIYARAPGAYIVYMHIKSCSCNSYYVTYVVQNTYSH